MNTATTTTTTNNNNKNNKHDNDHAQAAERSDHITIRCYITLYYTILYYTILYYNICFAMLCYALPRRAERPHCGKPRRYRGPSSADA